ncbi:MAG TPA: hypothetical protein VFD50_02680, partial [Thermoleophilia bacterium]|nr:hypothetical protein [Thermoleophilia bacterium]
ADAGGEQYCGPHLGGGGREVVTLHAGASVRESPAVPCSLACRVDVDGLTEVARRANARAANASPSPA